MANESIQLRAKAKSLNIEGYKAMSQDELKAAIKAAGKSSGKTAAKSASKNGATASPVKTAKKGSARKTAAKVTTPKKSSASKSTARKSAAKSAPAKSAKSGTAKRPASGGARKAPTGVGRVGIDNSAIDWTAESRVGQSGGNREVVMKALRKFKGNVDKVYAALADKAQTMYPKTDGGKKRSKADAQTLLRWHISRVKFDFVKDTGQHNGATRSKAAAPSKTAAKASGGKKSTPAKKSAQKPAQKRTTAKKSSAKKSAKKSSKR